MSQLHKAQAANIEKDIEGINKFNSTPSEGITRVLFTDVELEAREFVKERMRQLDLSISEDPIGNIFGRWEGSDPSLAPVWTGSHIDTVLNGGKFDGVAGVAAALEAVRIMKESGIHPRRSIEIVMFTSEEPTRLGMGCIGSRALAGKLSLEDARNLCDKNGESLVETLKRLGYNPEEFDQIKKQPGSVHAFLELHIEQAVVLENLKIPIGIVTAISAPTDIQVRITGKQGHAGATPMVLRKDPMISAAKIITDLEELVKGSNSPDTVGTVGRINAFPNASNVIPAYVDFTIDIRDSSFEAKDDIIKKLEYTMKKLAFTRDVTIDYEILCHDKAKKAEPFIVDTIKSVCRDLEQPFHEMPSGAYHDALLVADFAPFGMIFVPSKDGISHDRNEWTDFADIARGTDVLAGALIKLTE